VKTTIVALLCLVLPFAAVAGNADYSSVKYDGGSIANLKPGTSIRIIIQGDQILIDKGKTLVATIPASAVTEISYGQDVHRRIGTAIAVAVLVSPVGLLLALSKSKKHFVGLTWANGDVKGGFAMQCDKNDYRGILAGLEGVTGKKAVDSEAMNVKN
jgi:hypothetical protein